MEEMGYPSIERPAKRLGDELHPMSHDEHPFEEADGDASEYIPSSPSEAASAEAPQNETPAQTGRLVRGFDNRPRTTKTLRILHQEASCGGG